MTLAEDLKAATKPFHDTAEGHNFQRDLAAGLLPIATYTCYLEQLFLIHKALEKLIAEHSKTNQRLAKVVTIEQMQVPFLQNDLSLLRSAPDRIRPLTATANLIRQIESAGIDNPFSLLGFHYVLLGSKHGGKFIAANLRKKYNVNGDITKYFDPYGDKFMPLWRHFINTLNECVCSEQDSEEITKAAKNTFLAIADIGSELEHIPVK